MPKFECYYMGNSIGTLLSCNEQEIEKAVRSGEQYVMMQNNMKNSGMGGNNMMNQMNNGVAQMNPMQMSQQILNQAQITNPTYYNYLMQNPMVLQQMVQKQMLQMQQQQMFQNQSPMMGMMNGMNSMSNSVSNPMGNLIGGQAQQPIPQIPNLGLGTNAQQSSSMPSAQQIQQMFQIFQTMQQMGLINSNGHFQMPNQVNTTNTVPHTNTTSTNNSDEDKPIILKNGDKLIPLPGGKYGLVKKSN